MLPLLERMSDGLGLSVFTLAELIRTAPHRYKVFTIPKRNGTPRTIAQPAKVVKTIQRWLVAEELAQLPIHATAFAYKEGFGIRANAEAHSKGSFLLKMDVTNFFPSIGDRDLQLHLRKYGNDRWSDAEIGVIKSAVLWLPKRTRSRQLCIGGPSSPLISNSIMYDFDAEVSSFCQTINVVYTRYADDLTFSTQHPDVLRNVEVAVGTILRAISYPKLEINTEKTVRSSKAHLRRVTGLKITPQGIVSIGRERKREMRAKLHHFSQGTLSDEDALKLKGLIAFCMDVEPDFVARLKTKFGSVIVTRVMSLKSTPRLVQRP